MATIPIDFRQFDQTSLMLGYPLSETIDVIEVTPRHISLTMQAHG